MIRPYLPNDLAAAAGVWYRAGMDEYDYLPLFQALSTADATTIFRDRIAAEIKKVEGITDIKQRQDMAARVTIEQPQAGTVSPVPKELAATWTTTTFHDSGTINASGFVTQHREDVRRLTGQTTVPIGTPTA